MVVVDLPGFGASGGCWDFAGPSEQAAVKSAVEWAATQSWSSGKVAVVGQSYEGLTGVMALATRPQGLAAVATFAPDVSAYRELYTNGVPRWLSEIVGPFYLAYGLLPGVPADQASYQTHYVGRQLQPKCLAPEVSEWAGARWLDPNPETPFWRARDLLSRAAQSPVPVFGSQGFLDVEVPPSPSLSLFTRLGNLRNLWLGQYIHSNPVDQPEEVGADAAPQLQPFLDAAILGGAFPSDAPVVVQEAPDLRWRSETQWPPADARSYSLSVRPGSYLDTSGNASGDNVEDPPAPVVPTSFFPIHGQGSWTFTQPLPYEVHLAGVPKLRVQAVGSPAARLVALLYDVSPDGSAFLITRGATLLGSGKVDITLEPQDWRLAPGHRLGLLLSGADDSEYIVHAGTVGLIEVRSGTLTIPALQRLRDRFLDGRPGLAWGQVKRPIQIDKVTIERDTIAAELPPRESQPRSAGVTQTDSGGAGALPLASPSQWPRPTHDAVSGRILDPGRLVAQTILPADVTVLINRLLQRAALAVPLLLLGLVFMTLTAQVKRRIP